MSVITEAFVREHYQKNPHAPLRIQDTDVVTPSARQFLREQARREKFKEAKGSKTRAPQGAQTPVIENEYQPFEVVTTAFQPKFISHYDGGYYQEKPESMTHLSGNRLVYKDDLRIIFRGKLDSLQSKLLLLMHQVQGSSYPWLVDCLEELLGVTREVLRAEVMETPYEMPLLFGLDEAGLREHSHYPQKHYGIKHFVPNAQMGIEVLLLNELRTSFRELELVGVQTFRKGAAIEREDLVRVLNRMSSAAYILMCRIRGEHHQQPKP